MLSVEKSNREGWVEAVDSAEDLPLLATSFPAIPATAETEFHQLCIGEQNAEKVACW